MERRKHPRQDVGYPGLVSIGDKRFPCVVRNISLGGASLEIDKDYMSLLTRRDLGKRASFVYDDNYVKKARSFSGEVVRLFKNDEVAFLAIQFLVS